MSIKDLFDKRKQQTKTITSDSFFSGSKDVESTDYIAAKKKQFEEFIPHVNYATASNFAKYGSAEMYYESAFKRIYQQYPYDGTLEEKQQFELSSSYLDKHIFDKIYPRTNGYAIFSADGWGAVGATNDEFGNPTTVEYITIQGGPHTASSGMTTIATTFDDSMKYDLSTKRGSSLAFDVASSGSTIEFWFKKNGFQSTKTQKEVIFDLYNGSNGGVCLYLTSSAASSMELRVYSGSAYNQVSLGTTNLTDNTWRHCAVTIESAQAKFYLNGNLADTQTISNTIGDITGSLNATIGALYGALTGSSGTAAGDGKLSGSLDEFRYWKVARTGRQISNNWFVPLGGGTNKSTSNKDLGVYYKFNEGVVGSSSIDSTVLDYSGRIANGVWTGYTSNSRNTGSAMVLNGIAATEFKDPIIYSSHPDVSSSVAEYKTSGSMYDLENTSMFYHLLPSWVTEEDTETGGQLKNLCQIMGSYFDTLHNQISSSLHFRDMVYPSSSYKAVPFIDKIIKDQGFSVSENFVDSTIIEKFFDKDDNEVYEKSLNEVKNLIYHNIYNNLQFIYKSKGTEKSFRNLFHCYGIDSEIVKLNLYADDSTFVFKDNYEHTSIEKRYVDFNHSDRFESTIYLTSSASDADSLGFLSSSTAAASGSFTLEAEVIFPKKLKKHETGYFPTTFLSSSLFGYHKSEEWLGRGGYSNVWIDGQNPSGIDYGTGFGNKGYVEIGTRETWNDIIGHQGTKKWSYSGWVSPGRSIQHPASYLFFGSNGSVSLFFSGSSSNTDLYLWHRHVDGFAEFRTDATDWYKTGSWYHIAAIVDSSADGASGSLWVNGEIQALATNIASSGGIYSYLSQSVDFTIGNNLGGWIDEVAIFDDCLTPSEINSIYTTGRVESFTASPLTASNMALWYRMGEGSDTISQIYDVSGNGRNSTETAYIDIGSTYSASWAPASDVDMRVYALRSEMESDYGKFIVTGSDGLGIPYTLESPTYKLYDNNKWNLAFRVKPNSFPLVDGVCGPGHGYNYELYGVNSIGDTVLNEFVLSSSTDSSNFINDRYVYMGAHLDDFTGSVREYSDVKISSVRAWQSYLDDETIKLHSFDINNCGVKNPYRTDNMFQNLDGDILTSSIPNIHVPQIETLSLHWDFSTVTSSDSGGQFEVPDISSGSSNIVNRYGPWMGRAINYQHIGQAINFPTSSSKVVDRSFVYSAKQRLPEVVYSSNMVNVIDEDKEAFFQDPDVSDAFFSFEKSMYGIISEEMLKMFATVVDFNNLIGSPINKYRHKYKQMEALRSLFFEKVGNDPDIDKFTTFYKWIDSSISNAIQQLYPASARFSEGVRNMVESHVLERSKYVHKLPILTRKTATEGIIKGSTELNYDWGIGHAPIDGTENKNCLWQKERKERTGDREAIRRVLRNDVVFPSPNLKDNDNNTYNGSAYALKRLSKSYKLNMKTIYPIHAGTNYSHNKDRDFFRPYVSVHGATGFETGVPQNAYTVGLGTGSGTTAFKVCTDDLPTKRKYAFDILNGRINNYGYLGRLKGEQKFPFNFMSGSVATGYNSEVITGFKNDVVITNVHSDTYSQTNDIGMQSPFTETWVGGHQSRHVELNNFHPDLTANAPVNKRHSGIKASGSIELVFAQIADGDTLTINDGSGNVVYEFDSNDASGSGTVKITLGNQVVTKNSMESVVAANQDITITSKSVVTANIGIILVNENTGSSYNHAVTGSFASSTATPDGAFVGFAGGTNESNSIVYNQIDDKYSRPEGWLLKIGELTAPADGALGIVGPDYGGPYPDDSRKYAVRYRDERTKRPINIRNILHTTASTRLGNFQHNYEVVNTCGRKQNNYFARRNEASLLPNALDGILQETTLPLTTIGITPNTRYSNAFLDNDNYGNSNRAHNDGFYSTFNGLTSGDSSEVVIGTASDWNDIIGSDSDGYMSISAWIQPLGWGSNADADYGGTVLNFGSGDINVQITSDGEVRFFVDRASADGTWYTSGVLSLNKWYHVVVIYDSNTLNDPTIYIDGVKFTAADGNLTESSNPSGAFSGIAGYNCAIGDSTADSGRTFDGYIDEVAIWSRLLSEVEAKSIYRRGRAASLGDMPKTNLEAWYRMGGGNDTTSNIYDVSGNNRHSTSVVNVTIESNSYVKKIPDLENTGSNSIITSRFSSPGGPEINSIGYLDIHSNEYSAYNAMPWRNLSVLGSGSGESNSLRATDHIGQRRGLKTLLRSHSGKYGSDSTFGTSISAENYVTSPSYVKNNQNTSRRGAYLSSSVLTTKAVNIGIGSTDTYTHYFKLDSGSHSCWTHSYTFSAWVNPHDRSGSRELALFSKGNVSPGLDEVTLFVEEANDILKLRAYGAGPNYRRWSTDSGFLTTYTGSWVHVALTVNATNDYYSGDAVVLYINGEAVTFDVSSNGAATAKSGRTIKEVTFGACTTLATGEHFYGYMDEIAWFSSSLSADTIATIYNDGYYYDQYSEIDSIVHHWSMGDNASDELDSGTNITDAVRDSIGSSHLDAKNAQYMNFVDRSMTTRPTVGFTSTVKDNGFVSRPIPQSEFQYGWIRSAISGSQWEPGQEIMTYAPNSGIVSSSSGFVPALTFPSASTLIGV